LENVGRQRRKRSAGISHHFRRSYLKSNKVNKMKEQENLNKHIVFDSKMTLFTQKNYQN